MSEKKIRPLQLGSTDLMGTRFNGHDVHKELTRRGFDSHHLVWEKAGTDHGTSEICSAKQRRTIYDTLAKVERALSVQSLLQPFAYSLPFNRHFSSADIVHYHIIHSGYFSLASLPFLTHLKPTIWTLHDPWAMTGHCVHPYSCERWQTGCGSCPSLDSTFELKKDTTAILWNLKKQIYRFSKNLEIVVASEWMLKMVEKSPLFRDCKVHLIPFGVDLDIFKPGEQEKNKRKLGVIPGNLVICLRATDSEFKGLSCITEALNKLNLDQQITILTFNEIGHLDEFVGNKYQIIDLGWVNDLELIVSAYQAADIFLMPSTSEAFGMMTMEAMACGKPCIVTDVTSLPEVAKVPDGGIMIPPADSAALAHEISRLLNSKQLREEIGGRARMLAQKHYDVGRQVDQLINVYENAYSNLSKK